MIRRLAAALLAAAAPAAHAHGFGQRYDLPIPLSLYVLGAALVVAVSCAMFVLYLRAAPGERGFPRIDLLATGWGRLLVSSPMIAAVRLVALLAYLLILFAGFLGNQSPFRNVVPITIWALWWVGLAYFSALVGNLWIMANPLETVFAALEHLHARMFFGKQLSLHLPSPPWMQAWPAVALYLIFVWLEIAWDGSDSPRAIATAIAGYSIVTWAGMWIFGREAWLERGEAFSCVFGLLARFSPTRIGLTDRRVSEWHLRPYAVGLLDDARTDASATALVLVILAAVSFDGFLETPAWLAIVEGVSPDDAHWPRTAGLLLAPLLFAAVYLAFCRLIAMSAGMKGSAARIAGRFALTLVPIAIAYQVAHYLSFLAMAGQYMIPIASDPFGWGWNLFGTVNYFVRIGIVDARLVWIVSVGVIVTGHVAALYLGHVLALREFPDRRAAVRSQGPMLVLMVAYTMLSLWIIAQPIVTTR